MASYYRQQLEDWLRTIDVKVDRVIDIGGGANSVRGRTRSWEVKDYQVLDNELEPQKQKPDILCDLNENVGGRQLSVNQLDDLRINKFNMAFCLEVMEYIYNPLMALQNINWFLKKGGILYISFPFIYPHHNPEKHDYLRYTGWGVEKLLEKTGFKIEEITSRIETEPYVLQGCWRKEKMHPAKDYDNHSEIGY